MTRITAQFIAGGALCTVQCPIFSNDTANTVARVLIAEARARLGRKLVRLVHISNGKRSIGVVS